MLAFIVGLIVVSVFLCGVLIIAHYWEKNSNVYYWNMFSWNDNLSLTYVS